MPDASYIIDLILRARDDTAAAFASALGNQEAFTQALRDSETQAERNARAYQRASDDIRRSSKETAAGLKEVEAANKRILDQQVAVEQSARRVARVEADQTTSRRERLKNQIEANEQLKRSQAELAKLIRDHAIEQQRAAAGVDRLDKERLAAAKRYAQAQVELSRLEDNKIRKGRAAQRNLMQEAADRIHAIDEEIAAASRLDAATSARVSRDARRVATDRLKLEQLKEQDRVLKQLEASSKRFIETQDVTKANEFSKEIDRQSEALIRLGRARSEVEELKVGIKTERADTQFAKERDRIAKEQAEATVELQRFVDDEVKKSRAEREAALIEADRNEAKERSDRLKAEIAAEKSAEQERRAIARRDATRGKDVQSQERAQEREREAALRRVRLAAKGLSDIKITPEDFDEFRREIIAARQEYVRLGGSGRKAQEEVRKALDDTGASVSREHRKRLESLRGQEDEVRARAEITKATKDYVREIDRAGVAQAQLDRARKSTVQGDQDRVDAIERELALRKRAAETAGERLESVTQSTVVVNVDLDTGRAVTQAALFEAVKRELGRDVHINVDLDVASAAAAAAAMRNLGGSGDQAGNGLRNATNAVATIDNVLRGFLTLGVVLFLNQIAVAAIAAAGALVALAGSALYAGGALGGALTAGAAQAIPVLGVLGVAIQRFTKVIDAVKQSNLLQTQTAANAGRIAKGVTDAADRIVSAEEALANAQRRSRQAQEGINLARQQAARALQDLILREREAELAARGAALSQVEAQRELRRALSEGDTSSIARARLAVDAAPVAVDRAKQTLTTTRQDLRARQTGEAPEVKAAREQARAAAQAVAQAVRGLEAARRAAKETGAESVAAAGKLEELLKRLSPAERELYELLTKKGGLIDGFNELASTVGEPIIGAVTNMLTEVSDLVRDSNVLEPLVGLSEVIATQMEKVFDAFTTEEVGEQFLFFIEEAGENLPLLADIAINLGQAFLGIGEAGSPALAELLEYLLDLTDKFNEFVNSVDGQDALKTFFDEGVDQIKAIMDLLGAFGELFLSVVNPEVGGGATAGKTIIQGTADALRELNDAVNSPEGREKLQEFFANTVEVLKATKPILLAIGEAIDRTFDEGGVKNFKAGAEIISRVLIPALADLLEFMGLVTRAFAVLIDIPLVGTFVRGAIAIAAINLIIGRLIRLFLALPIIGPILTRIGTALLALGRRALLSAAQMLFWRLEVLRAAATARIVAGITAISTALQALGTRLAATRIGMILLTAAQRGLALASRVAATAFWLVNGALFANPIGLVILAIIALVAIFVVAYKKSETFRNIVKGAFNAVRNAAESAFNWLKQNWPLVLAILTGPFGIAVLLIVKNWKRIREAFNDGVEWIKGFGSDIKDALSGVWDGFVSGAKAAINGVIDLFNLGIKAINAITPGPLKVAGKTIIPGIPDIPEIPHLATGGVIGGNFAEGDKYTVKVAGEEVILNPAQQLMIGRDRIMGALRATGAKFLRPGGSYATGGFPQPDVTLTGDRRDGPRRVAVNVDADTEGQAKKWRLMWQEINASTRRNAQIVEARIRLMRTNITATMERLHKDFAHKWQDIEDSAKRHATDLYKGVRGSINALTQTIYSGMSYIGNATNTVLKTFDAEPVTFSLSAPKTGRAAMGYIGQPGERGGDAIPIMVGRGEGVINWAHQKFIEPALHAMYGFGLQDLFKRTGGYHAGGHDDMGMPGFAEGGFTGPWGSGAAFNAISNFAKSKFGLSMTSGKTNHSVTTKSGNISDHSRGWAGDFSNGVLTPQEDAFSNFWKSKLPQVVKQLIWRNVDQFRGFPVGGHEDHVHLAVQRQYAFDNTKMARLISRSMRGLKISDLLSKVTGDIAEVDHVDPQKLRGKRGSLFTIIQKALSKVRGAANKYIDKKFGATAPSVGDGGPSHGEKYDGPLNRVFPSHSLGNAGGHAQLTPQQVMSLAQKAGLPGRTFEQIAHGESNYYPGIISNDGGYGLWQMTPRVWGPAGVAAMNKLGGLGAMLNPWKNALMAKYLYGQAGNKITPWYGTKYVTAARGMAPAAARFARGGFVGGSGPFAGFRRAATGLESLSTEQQRLRSMRKSTRYIAPDLLPIDYEGTVREFNFAVRQIRRIIARHDNAAKKLHARAAQINKNLEEITRDKGLLDQMGTAIERFTRQIAIRLRERALKISKTGIVSRVLDPATEAAQLQKNAQAVIRRNQSLLKRINDLLKASDVELGRVNRRIGQLEKLGTKRTDKQDDELSDLRADRGDLIANQRNLRDRALAAREAIADQIEAIYQAQLEAFNKQTEAAVAEAGGGGGSRINDLAIRVAEAFGRSTTALQERRIGIMHAQSAALQQQLAIATSRGYADEAKAIREQIDELGASIQEATAALLASAVAEAQAAFDRQDARFALQDRLTAVRERLGDRVGAAQATTSTLQARQGFIASQRDALVGFLGQAQAQGNVALINELTGKIEDLNVQLHENARAIQESIIATRQLSLTLITDRSARSTGLIGSAAEIIKKLGALSGNTEDTQKLIGFAQQILAALTSAARDLVANINETIGSGIFSPEASSLLAQLAAAFAQGPEGFATTLGGLGGQIAALEATLGQAEREAFQALIQAMIDNTGATIDATAELETLNGQGTQQFSSSAWTQLRSALFNGLGQLLPRFQVPHLDTGGFIERDGMAMLHRGEVFTAAQVSNRTTGGTTIYEGDTNVEVNEAGRTPDIRHLTSAIAFARRTSGNRR